MLGAVVALDGEAAAVRLGGGRSLHQRFGRNICCSQGAICNPSACEDIPYVEAVAPPIRPSAPHACMSCLVGTCRFDGLPVCLGVSFGGNRFVQACQAVQAPYRFAVNWFVRMSVARLPHSMGVVEGSLLAYVLDHVPYRLVHSGSHQFLFPISSLFGHLACAKRLV